MKHLYKNGDIDQFIEEIISKLPLRDRVNIANMSQEHVDFLQAVFELYIIKKTGVEFDDEEYKDLMGRLWKRLEETHKLRIVK